MNEFKLLSRNFIFVCISGFLYFGSFYLLLPMLPQFVATLGGTVSQIGIVVGIFTIGSVIFRPYFGKLADNCGRKKVMLLGAGLFALLFAIYGMLQEIAPLYLLRVFHGIAHGIYLAAAFAYVADLAPFDRRGEVMGIYGVAHVVAMAIFPALGTMIIANTQDFSILFLCSVVAAGASFLAIFFIDEIKIEKEQQQTVKLLSIGRKPAVLVASLTYFTAATVYGSVIAFLPVYAPNQGIENFGVFFTTYAVFTLISRLVAGKLSDRYGRRKVVLPFLVILIIATFLLSSLDSIFLLIFIGGCFGLGFGAIMPTLNALVVDRVQPHERAGALAFFTSFMDIGITAGAVVLGVVGEYWGYGIMYSAGGIFVCLGTLLFASYIKEPSAQSEVEKV